MAMAICIQEYSQNIVKYIDVVDLEIWVCCIKLTSWLSLHITYWCYQLVFNPGKVKISNTDSQGREKTWMINTMQSPSVSYLAMEQWKKISLVNSLTRTIKHKSYILQLHLLYFRSGQACYPVQSATWMSGWCLSFSAPTTFSAAEEGVMSPQRMKIKRPV